MRKRLGSREGREETVRQGGRGNGWQNIRKGNMIIIYECIAGKGN